MGNWIWVLIPLAAIAASVFRAKYRYERHERLNGDGGDPEAERLGEEVRSLKDRVIVLERIVTDRSHTLDGEIERLRSH